MVPVHSSGRVSRGRIERLPGGRVGALRAEDLADGDQPFDQRLCQDLWRKVPLEKAIKAAKAACSKAKAVY